MQKHLYVSIIGAILSIYNISAHATGETPSCRCKPNQSCWPGQQDWASLQKQLTGKLIKPVPTIETCQKDASSAACKAAIIDIHNPFFDETQPGNTQSQGWVNAWNSQASTYAVEAETTKDVVAAVNFARQHHIKLVIKGTGHDYLGRSNAPDSLLIWTHKMRQMNYDPSFIPAGCPANEKGIPAITVGAGTRWIEAYGKVTTELHRYVQGGGCTSVGAAGGFPQGGGFGSYSKKFGTGAAGIVQAEIVTADGNTLIANKCQHQDLFWAIRGGGAGTFGVVTKLTLLTHPLPSTFGNIQGIISAKNDDAYKTLLKKLIQFYRDKLNNEHWGEQISFDQDNTINLSMLFQGLSNEQVMKTWQPLETWIKKNPGLYTMKMDVSFVPPTKKWDYSYLEKNRPKSIVLNTAKGASKGEFWWASNSNEVSAYWYTYQSWWLPLSLFSDTNTDKLADIFFKASRLTPFTFHINKGLAGASKDAIHRGHDTSTNPSVYDAAGLVIMAAGVNTFYPGIKGHEPDLKIAQAKIQNINSAMQLFREAAPNAGAYANEADYFMKNWQKVFWGDNYDKLYAIKQKYDPQGVFYCHHCVGSEIWTANGMCKQ